ncbi:phosphoglycerate kinase [Thiotrichales bacterium 19S3-7]|nr:phosphoglycerate kinase [Thiotrichales bacterium 19S3-7]MCF6801507.1 phosphoglycerate kinase [Thiotrichales bacterium 19S3-11]
MDILKVTDLDLSGQRVLIRVDFNVPVKDGRVVSDIRIKAALPTIKLALEQNAKVMLMSHLGRPEEGVYDETYSLEPVAKRLSELLEQPVRLIKDYLTETVSVNDGEVVLFENVRFNVGEKKNDQQLAKKLAHNCDIFVMDAFATAHRAQSSTYGVAEFSPVACAGILLANEVDALSKALSNPKRPLVAIVGGSKVTTKLTVLKNLAQQVDQLIVGGGIANTFLAATGNEVGASLYEPDLVDQANEILSDINSRGGDLPLPSDVRVAKEFSETAPAMVKALSEIKPTDMILDVGPSFETELEHILAQAGTILWNGPVGVFEFDNFSEGTKALANAIADSSAFSVAGGGDTIAAIEKFAIEDKISYISTAGGAFLEFLEGNVLPAIEILERRAKNKVNV